MNNFAERLKKFASSQLFETLQTVFFSFVFTAVIYIFLAVPNQVDGASMETNFHHGELILTNKFIQLINDAGLGDDISYEYERGDVIIFQQLGRDDYIKRIIAKENDTIKIENGSVFVNGKKIIEDYIPDSEEFRTEIPSESPPFLDEGEERTVPLDKYFVMGDNRKHSQDSRFDSVGWVDKEEIKGRVFFKYWPLNEISLIQRGSFHEE